MQPTPPDSPVDSTHQSSFEAWPKRIGGRLMRRLTSRDSVPRTSKTLPQPATSPQEPPPTGMSAAVWDLVRDVPRLGLGSIKTLVRVQEAAALSEEVDDRTYLMEKLIQAAVKVSDDKIGQHITNNFVSVLWNDLQHPPEMYMSKQFRYRQADGSHNSWLHPHLGAAHQPYARTVKPAMVQPASLPDPGVVFDSVLVRKKATPHPNKISSVLFYLASIIIHDIFRTNHRDYAMSDTSSYLDLAPLYGSDGDEQKNMRTYQDGKIKPDCFSETRLLSFPPGVGALLIMFNRFHNHVVEQLAAINEKGRFDPPNATNRKTMADVDEDLFQTGRLVTCGLYINIILIDYVRTILNLNKTDDNWQLNPRATYAGGPEIGTGNQVSAEFNLVYRWHAAISDRDDKWTQQLFKDLFDGRSFDDVPQREFLMKLATMEKDLMSMPPDQRPFAKLSRQTDNKYKDEDLVGIMLDSIDDCSNAFGPQQVPAVMKAIEVLGIQQARSWNLATLNEFRKHFSLKPHQTFSDITKEERVAQQLEHLYGHPDYVELYPGLVVEDAKVPMLPGSGLCPSYTVSRAVLSDAVALVRGDRFYTTSYQPSLLTNWGFAEAGSDLNVDNGCVFYKLFLGAFPGHFDPDSSYIHYPMTVASEMSRVLTSLGKADRYNFERPSVVSRSKTALASAPQPGGKDYEADVDSVEASIRFLDGKDRLYKRPTATILDRIQNSNGIDSKALIQRSRDFVETKTTELLSRKSYVLASFAETDVVRDIVNVVPILLVADLFAIPLKSTEHPEGTISAIELYDLMIAISVCESDFDDAESIVLRHQARTKVSELRTTMFSSSSFLKDNPRHIEGFLHRIGKNHSHLVALGHPFIKNLSSSGLKETYVFAAVMLLASAMTTYQSALVSEFLDAFLQSPPEITTRMRHLAEQKTSESEDQLLKSILELAHSPAKPVILLSNPQVNTGVWKQIDDGALLSMVKVILRTCPGLRPARVWEGHSALATLKKIPLIRANAVKDVNAAGSTENEGGDQGETTEKDDVAHVYLTEKWDRIAPFSTTLKVNWDLTAEGYPTPASSVHSES